MQNDPRHVARAVALQHLFTELIAHGNAFEDNDLLLELDAAELNSDLTHEIVEGVKAHLADIDPIIQELAPAWPISQIAPVDLIILRMGIWEGFIAKFDTPTPPKVVIDQCIELAKEFGGPSSRSFVNGVLGNLLQNADLQAKLETIAGVAPETISKAL